MANELNNETWMLRSARLDKPSQVQKLLREGFEPFWGMVVTVNKDVNGVIEKEKVVKMYFRKAPEFIITTTEENIVDPFAPLNEFSNQFRSALSGLLDGFMNRFFEEMDKHLPDEPPLVSEAGAHRSLKIDDGNDLVKKEEVSDKEPLPPKQPDAQNNGPQGDDFRVVDDVPPQAITTTERTAAQDLAIDGLRSQSNVTILPGMTETGAVRCMVGADLYTIESDGNFTVENTGAGTDSTMVGG